MIWLLDILVKICLVDWAKNRSVSQTFDILWNIRFDLLFSPVTGARNGRDITPLCEVEQKARFWERPDQSLFAFFCVMRLRLPLNNKTFRTVTLPTGGLKGTIFNLVLSSNKCNYPKWISGNLKNRDILGRYVSLIIYGFFLKFNNHPPLRKEKSFVK